MNKLRSYKFLKIIWMKLPIFNKSSVDCVDEKLKTSKTWMIMKTFGYTILCWVATLEVAQNPKTSLVLRWKTLEIMDYTNIPILRYLLKDSLMAKFIILIVSCHDSISHIPYFNFYPFFTFPKFPLCCQVFYVFKISLYIFYMSSKLL